MRVNSIGSMTHMVRMQVDLPEEDLKALQRVARRSGRSASDLVRDAICRVWLRRAPTGPVALWDGNPTRTSVEHDAIYDEP